MNLMIAIGYNNLHLRIIGRGDEIDVIKRECAEVYEQRGQEQWEHG